MNKYTNEKTDIIRLSASVLPERNLPKTVSYENTECKFICNEETVVINETNATELNVGIKRPDKYYYLDGEDARFPVELLFAVDDKTYNMFQTYNQISDKQNALKQYAKKHKKDACNRYVVEGCGYPCRVPVRSESQHSSSRFPGRLGCSVLCRN